MMFRANIKNKSVSSYHTIVIGGGPSGVAASYCLSQHGIDHIVLEKSQYVAPSWRQTWDNFELAMPVSELYVPGYDFSHFPSNKHLKRDEIIAVFENYAKDNQLPIEFNVEIDHIIKENNKFIIFTNLGACSANNIIVCTGPRHRLKIPPFAKELPKEQVIFGAYYKNTEILGTNMSNILIVGSGYSALNIAYDITQNSNHQLHLACSYQDRQIQTNNSHVLFNHGKNTERFSLNYFLQKGIPNHGRLISVENNQLIFVNQNEKHRIHSTYFHKVIFATGYEYFFPMLSELPGMNSTQLPKQENGKTQINGLYVVGIPKDNTQRTVTITQGSREAEECVNDIVSEPNIKLAKAKL